MTVRFIPSDRLVWWIAFYIVRTIIFAGVGCVAAAWLVAVWEGPISHPRHPNIPDWAGLVLWWMLIVLLEQTIGSWLTRHERHMLGQP